MARSKKIAEEKAPLWLIIGVMLGAVIVYLAMTGKEKEGGPAISNVRMPANDAPSELREAPERSGPLTKDMIPEGAVRIQVTKETFSPSEFFVRSGEMVTLAVTSGDEFTHVFAFEDPSLQGVALGVSAKETRVIRFNAPEEGEYVFYQNMPGFQNVRGVMIVEKE